MGNLLDRRNYVPLPHAAQHAERDGYSTDEDEDHVPGHAHPFQLVVETAHQECQTTRVPVSIGDGIPELENATGKQVQEDHKGKAHISAPETYPDELLCS